MIKVVSASMTGISKLKEPRSWSIRFHTQEVSTQDAIELTELNGQFVKLAISDSNISEKVQEAIDATHIEGNERFSASQKLRFAIVELAQRNGVVEKKDIENFYQSKMKQIINHINNKQ